MNQEILAFATIMAFLVGWMVGHKLESRKQGPRRTRKRRVEEKKRVHVTPELKTQMRNFRAAGMTNPEIANQTGASITSVTRHIGKQPLKEVRQNLEQMNLSGKSKPQPV